MDRPSQKFDRQLFTLKMSEVSQEMQARSTASDRNASAEVRKGTGSLLLNIANGQLALLEDWLEGVDRICREVWQIQGETVTAEFVRDVLVPEAMVLIETRKGTVMSNIELIARRTNDTDPYRALGHLAKETNRLKATVSNRYEIEVRTLEYKKVPGIVNSAKLSSSPQADEWQGFYAKFTQLAGEEQKIERAAPKDRLLRAYCDYKKHPEILHEKGKPEHGRFALLKTPPTGLWMLSDGVSENFQARFRVLTARAGVAIGCPTGTDPEDFWLHRLWLDLQENHSEQLFAASEEGGMIRRVCVASATFCSRLERKALEQSENAAEKITSQEVQRGTEEPLAERSSFDPSENLRDAISLKKAHIAEIERTLSQPLPTEHQGRPVHGGEAWRLHLEQERQHLLLAVRELDADVERNSASQRSSVARSAAHNSDETTQGWGIISTSSAPPLPTTWEELRKQNSISQMQAAQFLKCDPRTVRRYVQKRELTPSRKGRIVCNELLRNQIRKVHGEHVLR